MKLTITDNKKVHKHEVEIERLGQVKEHVKAFGLIHKVDEIVWTVTGDGSITSPIQNGERP